MTFPSKILSNLTPPERSSFSKAINLFQPSPNVIKKAFQYYQQFNSLHQEQNYLLDDVVNIAIFFAENMEDIRDLAGEKIHEIGFNTNQIIKGCESIVNSVEIMNHFIKLVKFADPQIKRQVKNVIEKISFTHRQAKLFQEKIQLLELKEKVIESYGYKETFKSLAWLLYVDSREHIFGERMLGKTQENSCLMAAIFYLKIRYSLEYIKPKKVNYDDVLSTKDLIMIILDELLKVFEIQNIQMFRLISQKFDEYFQAMIQKSIMKVSRSETDFFSPFIININYKRLDNKYQKALKPDDLDFRLFWKDKLLNLTPSKHNQIAPFVNKKRSRPISNKVKDQKKFASHRALNYDDEFENLQQQVQISSQKDKMPFIIKPNTSFTSESKELNAVPLECQPQIYRYVCKKTRTGKKRKLDQEMIKLIEESFSHFQPENPNLNKKLTYLMTFNLFKGFAEMFRDEDVVGEVLICLSMQIMKLLYCPRQSFSKFDLILYIRELCGLNEQLLSSIWLVCSRLINYDTSMPNSLKLHLISVVEDLFEEQCWVHKTFIDEIAELAANYEKSQNFMEMVEQIMSYSEKLLYKLGMELNLSESICEGAYNCLKFVMCVSGDLLYRQKLDQIILCCLYISCKKNEDLTKFADIKVVYEKFYIDKSLKRNIFFDLSMSDGNGDIVTFYNRIFLPVLKPFLPYMAEPSLEHLHPIFQNLLIHDDEEYQQGLEPVNVNIINERGQYKKQSNMQINIQTSNRHETRVRIRPPLLICERVGLCQTEKIKENHQ